MNLGRLKSIIAAATTTALSLLGSIHLAAAQQEQEVLRLAKEKVQLATSAGAFGHGIPLLNTNAGSDLVTMALILSIVAIGIVGAVSYYVLKNERIQDAIAIMEVVSN